MCMRIFRCICVYVQSQQRSNKRQFEISLRCPIIIMPYNLSILVWFSVFWASRAFDYFHLDDKSGGSPITSLVISSDNSIIIFAHSQVFEIYRKAGTNSYTFSSNPAVPAGNILCLDLTTDAEIAAIGLDTNAVIIYQLNGMFGVNLLQTLTEATDMVSSISFSKDQTLLLSGSKDSKARLYLLHGGSYILIRIMSDAAPSSQITACAISTDNQYLYTADSTGKIRIYTKQSAGYSLTQTIATSSKVNSISVSGDSSTLTACQEDGLLKIYLLTFNVNLVTTYQLLQMLNDTTDPLASTTISSDGKVITASSPTTSTIWVYEMGANFAYYLKLSNLTGSLSKISLDKTIILGSSNTFLKIYQVCSISNCKLCSTFTFCTECNEGFFAASDGTCGGCNSNCSTCLSLATSCTGCVPGYYVDISHFCQPCPTGCKNCSSNGVTCTVCFDKFYLSGASCLPCQSNCSRCTNFTDCVACSSNYYNSSGTCLPCIPPCNKCLNLTKCLGCVNTHYLLIQSCVLCEHPCLTCSELNVCESCVASYYQSQNEFCFPCRQFCLSCTDLETCTVCNPAFANVYHNGTTCVFCPYNCSACTNPSTCTACSVGFYPSGPSCPKCNSSCTSCTSALVCTGCSSQYTLSSGRCINCPSNCLNCTSDLSCSACKKHYYLQNSVCVICSMPGCTYCTSQNQCLLCEGGYSLVNSVCQSFQTSPDPYAYVKQITLTHNQSLSLIITIIVLIAIFLLGFGVYYWIMKTLDEQGEEGEETRNQGNQTGQPQPQPQIESHNISETHVMGDARPQIIL